MEMQISSPNVSGGVWLDIDSDWLPKDRDEVARVIRRPAGNLAVTAAAEGEDVVCPAETGVTEPSQDEVVAEDDVEISVDGMEAARGGNYKVVRENLKKGGKANSKKPMSVLRKKLRQRKRKSK